MWLMFCGSAVCGSLIHLTSVAPQGAVRKAVETSVEIAGKTVQPQRCRPTVMKWDFKQEREKTKVYVSNLSMKIEKRQLREIFSKVGGCTWHCCDSSWVSTRRATIAWTSES
jgi:hypothetical protein